MIDKYVSVPLNSRNAKYFKDLGYELPQNTELSNAKLGYSRGTEIKVKVSDLKKGSKIKVKRTCDACSREDLVSWRDMGSTELCSTCSRSKHSSGKNNPMYGRVLSPESRQEATEKLIARTFTKLGYSTYEDFTKALFNYIEKTGFSPTSSQVENKFSLSKQTILNIINRKNRRDLLFCNMSTSSSEIEILNFLKTIYSGEIIVNDRSVLNGKELDIYLPELKLAIEFNGLFWHSEDKVGKKYHYDKYIECKNKDIALYTIWEHIYKDSSEKVLGFLKALIEPKRRVYARKCNIVSDEDKLKAYIKQHHLQGVRHGGEYLGLEFQGNIVMAISVSKHHRGGNTEALNRVCFSEYHVLGGLQKLLKHLNKEVITWSDNAYSPFGTMYQNNNFILEEELKPDYFYTRGNGEYLSKQSQMKSNTGCPEGMTELEWATQRGLFRVWDCGKKRWRWTPGSI